MNIQIHEKLIQFLEQLENSSQVKEFQKVEQKIMEDPDFLKQIDQFHKLQRYDPMYKEIKQQLFQNKDYKRYLELSQQLYYWTLEMTQKLKEITSEGKDENH